MKTKMDIREGDTALLLLGNCMPQSLWNLNSGRDPIFLGTDLNVAPIQEYALDARVEAFMKSDVRQCVDVCVCVCVTCKLYSRGKKTPAAAQKCEWKEWEEW